MTITTGDTLVVDARKAARDLAPGDWILHYAKWMRVAGVTPLQGVMTLDPDEAGAVMVALIDPSTGATATRRMTAGEWVQTVRAVMS